MFCDMKFMKALQILQLLLFKEIQTNTDIFADIKLDRRVINFKN